MKNSRQRATEIEYLRWFIANTDFGPAHSDVMDIMNQEFMRSTGMNLPLGYNISQNGETVIDED